MHDLLHDLAKKVAGSECLTIENGKIGHFPQDVRHLFIEIHGEEKISQEALQLKELRTMIITHSDLTEKLTVEIFESVFTKLPKLRVLILKAHWFDKSKSVVSIPTSIGRLRHLRYFAFSGSFMYFGV